MEKIKVHLYDWRELTDQLVLNESQLKLLKFLYENDYFREDMRYEVINEEIEYRGNFEFYGGIYDFRTD